MGCINCGTNNGGLYDVQQVMPLLIQQVISGVILVVILVWGFRNVRRSIRGEPLEEIPI